MAFSQSVLALKGSRGTMSKQLAILTFGILVVLANPDLMPTNGRVPSKKLFQPWEKQGRIIAPGFAGPQSQSRVSAPSVVRLKNGRLRMYFWATGRGHHYIYAAEASPKNPYDWKLVKEEPVLGPSPNGNINDKGPSFPWVVQQDNRWLMYYATWGSWAPPDELSNRTGLAISDDEGIHWKVLKEPLLPLGKSGDYDAGVTGSVAVLRTGPQTYQMWYTAGERYAILDWISPGFKRGIVHVGHAVSRDGVDWVKSQKPVLSPRLDAAKPYEAVVSKPGIILMNGTYHMWLSVFTMQEGGGYHLNYARSRDGLAWERFADEEVMPLTPGGFDSNHQSYANVIEQGDELWMFYVGNTFGATGIGLATMKKSELR
jgi:predicted GH43/DUF377 family glycosyl hydrolase